MPRRIAPADVALVHDGERWTLSFGRYQLQVRACNCDRPICMCKRGRARWDRRTNHEYTNCHAGHPEHMALLYRRAIGTVRKGRAR